MLIDLIYYDLKVAALIAVFYLFYMLLLARETTHTLNRVVLLLGLTLSAILPLCIITIHKSLVLSPSSVEAGSRYAQELMNDDYQMVDAATPLSWEDGLGLRLLAVVLLMGIIIRLLYFAKGIWQLNRIIRSGEKHTLASGTNVCVVNAPVAPFSWMRTIVMSRNDWNASPLQEGGATPILAHEEAHVRHHHSYDVMFVEILTALQWFNPVVWFMRQELRTIHEYEADASVLSQGFDESQYIHLLMQKATGIQACALANGIHTPKTKKRILMMLKSKSKPIAWLKALYILPIALVSLAMTAETVVDYEVTTTDENLMTTKPMKYSPKMSDTEFINYVKQQQAAGLTNSALTQIMLNEGSGISRAHILHLNSVYGSKKSYLFIVDDKEVSSEEFCKLPPEAIISAKVMDVGPAQKAYGEKGRRGATVVKTGLTASTVTQQGDDPIYDDCDQKPQFPGGDEALMKFIAQNIKYPEIATENGVQGRVIVQFTVEKDGSLTSPKVITTSPGIGEAIPIEVVASMPEKERKDAEAHNAGVKALRDEAIRVVKAMPKWTPGKQQGKVVRCRRTYPVVYRLN
ncbi:MAG: M56 family metallopeptidase [Prevotella sp.]|nr:M56 family metallopeptidase [Prevotella sp.]